MRRPALAASLAAVAVLMVVGPACATTADRGAKPPRANAGQGAEPPRAETADLPARLRAADGAFVGRLVARHGRVLTFRVDVRLKGVTGRRVRVHTRRHLRRGRRVGVLLDRRAGHWAAQEVVSPGELLKAAGIGP